MNNYERIKAMTLDEMADYLYLIENGRIYGCGKCKNSKCCDDLMFAGQPYEHLCKDFIKQWLQAGSEG